MMQKTKEEPPRKRLRGIFKEDEISTVDPDLKKKEKQEIAIKTDPMPLMDKEEEEKPKKEEIKILTCHRAGFFTFPILSHNIILCSHCRESLNQQPIDFDQNGTGTFKMTLCISCLNLNRTVRSLYRNSLFPLKK